MLKLYSDTKIFVHCPAGVVTGGAELLHQIVHILRGEKLQAFIVYYGTKEHLLPTEYACYNVDIADAVVDSEKNIEIIYEGVFNFIRNHCNTQKILWWLSVDHFFMCAAPYLALQDLFRWDVKMGIKAVLRRSFNSIFKNGKGGFRNTISINELRHLNAMHGYQSEYAQNFLQNRGFGELVALKDFINTDHIHSFSVADRKDIILYNPKKGMSFTRKLIDMAPDLQWIAVQNMTRSQLVELMRESKLYLDFGYHPGKDRLPRECAMNGCCIITGKRGSAGFFEDVAIADKYKFDEKSSSEKEIIERVRDTLEHYDAAINDFAYYRGVILREKKEFEEQVKNLFNC